MKNLREQMNEFIEVSAGSAMVADGFDEAFIGVASGFNTEPVAVYDREKVHDILCEEHGMTSEEAIEFFYYNIIIRGVGAGMDNAPLFLDSFEYKEER